MLECSLHCVQFYLLSQKHLLAPSGVLISQLLTEHKHFTAAAAGAAAGAAAEGISHRSK